MAPRYLRFSELRCRALSVGAVVLSWIALVEVWAPRGRVDHWVPDLSVGVMLVACSIVATANGERPDVGTALACAGGLWFAGNLQSTGLSFAVWPAQHLAFSAGPTLALASLLLGRRRRPGRIGFLLVVGTMFVWSFAVPFMVAPVGVVTLSLATVVAGIVVMRRPWNGHAVAGLLIGALAAGVSAVAFDRARSVGERLDAEHLDEAGIVATGLLVVAGCVRERLRRERVADEVLEITDGPVGSIRKGLRSALGDDEVEVAFAAAGGWVDEYGRARLPLSPDAVRSIVDITVDGDIVAQLSVTTRVARQPEVLTAIRSATDVAAKNARLHAALRAEALELDGSRRRLLVAADEQRLQLAQDLERATATPLNEVAEVLAHIDASGSDVTNELIERSRERLALLTDDLHSLAAGLGPTALEDGDLSMALHYLTAGIPLDIAVELEAVEIPHDLAVVVYFVCAEATANAIKYAAARHLQLRVGWSHNQHLEVVATDDGVGGALIEGGTGLRGLQDRVDAFGGRLGIVSPAGGGTTLRAVFPVARPGAEPSRDAAPG